MKDNVIKFERPKTIKVTEPVRVSRADANLISNYLDEETALMTDHLSPKPNLTLDKSNNSC